METSKSHENGVPFSLAHQVYFRGVNLEIEVKIGKKMVKLPHRGGNHLPIVGWSTPLKWQGFVALANYSTTPYLAYKIG